MLVQERPFEPMMSCRPPPHQIARSQGNPDYPQRDRVADAKVPWAEAWDAYAPRAYTHFLVRENDRSKKPCGEQPSPSRWWADPEA